MLDFLSEIMCPCSLFVENTKVSEKDFQNKSDVSRPSKFALKKAALSKLDLNFCPKKSSYQDSSLRIPTYLVRKISYKRCAKQQPETGPSKFALKKAALPKLDFFTTESQSHRENFKN